MSQFWKSARKWLPGVIISLIAIVAIIYFVDWKRFVDAIRSANYWLLLVFLASSVEIGRASCRERVSNEV
jgi:uncharacterized membrane protein YbhN (UPF0104 family)